MKNKNESKKKTITILLSVLAILIVVGVAIAYFTSQSSTEDQTVTTGKLKIEYVSGQDISATFVFPTLEDEAQIHKFTINNTGTLAADYKIAFTDISFIKDSSNVTSDNLKWTLYKSDSSYVINEDAVATGTFGSTSSYTAGTTSLDIINNQSLGVGSSQSYVLKIWLNETGALQNEDQNLEFNAKITVEAIKS